MAENTKLTYEKFSTDVKEAASLPQMPTEKHLLFFHLRWFCVLDVVRTAFAILSNTGTELN